MNESEAKFAHQLEIILGWMNLLLVLLGFRVPLLGAPV